ncbi:MAG: 2-hydroxyacid dehydrogenase [Erysipelotrichaceae bacterium]|nr:2-hydroxyacid dehydrogenase [Erysipelotrichaceae bacterium]
MKKKILLTNRYEGELAALLRENVAGRFDLQMLEKVDRSELIKSIEDADYLLMSGKLEIDEEVIASAKKLKMIQRTGVGLDSIDLDVLKRHGIPLYVNKGVNAVSVAEYTLMLMLATLKNTYSVWPEMKDGKWNKQKNGIKTHELFGKTVGIIGMGNIGKRVAKMLNGFDCHIVYYDQFRQNEEIEKELHLTYLSLDELLRSSDIISLHCPYDKKTGKIITKQQIGLMKDGVILINTARGKLIDEKALTEALKSGKIAACGLDTFEEEPLKADSELRTLPNVLLSPHIAGLAYEAYERMFKEALHNIDLFDSGQIEQISNCLVA